MSTSLVLRVLGSVRVTGVDRPLTSQQLALITYLGCVGPASPTVLVDALWAGRPISAGRFANLVSEVRATIGREHLPALDADRYRLQDVPTDLELLIELTRPADRADGDVPVPSVTAQIAALEAAIGLVGGPVFATPAVRSWWWLDGHPEVVARAEAVVARTALRLVSLLWSEGELERAQNVCQRGLACCPLDRDLVMALEGLHRAQGRPATANRLLASWRLQVERLTGEDPLARSAATLIADRQASIGSAVTTTLPT